MHLLNSFLFIPVGCSLCMAPLTPALHASETAPVEYWQLEYGAGTLQRSTPWQPPVAVAGA